MFDRREDFVEGEAATLEIADYAASLSVVGELIIEVGEAAQQLLA